MYRKKGKFGFGLHDIQVRVQRAIDMDALNIVIWIRKSDGTYFIGEPMELKFRRQKSGERQEPTLQISGELAGDLLDALTEELGNAGIKTKNDSKTEGILEAQSKHLSDLQELVFKERRKK
jgi:hypothetical protein